MPPRPRPQLDDEEIERALFTALVKIADAIADLILAGAERLRR